MNQDDDIGNNINVRKIEWFDHLSFAFYGLAKEFKTDIFV